MKYALLFLTTILFSSCSTIDEDVIPYVGIYRGHIVGVSGPFDVIVSTDRGDNILIEAPFDGDIWDVITADIDHPNDPIVDVQIDRQSLDSQTQIQGEGFFSGPVLELRYSINFRGDVRHFKLVASK